MIERDETTGLAKVEWDNSRESEDINNLRIFLRTPFGGKFLTWLQAMAINEAFAAIGHPNHAYACGYAQGMKTLTDTISACGLSPAKVQPPTKEEALQAELLAKAGLEHLGH